MKSLKPLFLNMLAAILIAGSVAAQDSSPAPKPKQERGLTVRLLAIGLVDGAEELQIRSGEGEISPPIEVTTHGFSKPARVTARDLSLTLPSVDGQKVKIISRATLPESGRRFLLLLTPSKGRYASRVVQLDNPDFKADRVCFFNASPIQVAGSLGSRKFLAKPGTPVIAAAPDQKDLPFYQVKFFYKHEGEVRHFADTRWPHDDRGRSYVFFFTHPKTKRISYRAVDEYLEPES